MATNDPKKPHALDAEIAKQTARAAEAVKLSDRKDAADKVKYLRHLKKTLAL